MYFALLFFIPILYRKGEHHPTPICPPPPDLIRIYMLQVPMPSSSVQFFNMPGSDTPDNSNLGSFETFEIHLLVLFIILSILFMQYNI